MRRGITAATIVVFGVLVACCAAAPAFAGQLRAGVGVVDASWHVGASAGQYASSCDDSANVQSNRCSFIGDHGVDPTTDSTRRVSSYGVQERLQARAIVVEGPDGRRIAIVKQDLYIPQDLLYRRTGQLLAADPALRIDASNLIMSASHDHSSPYYSSPSWGVWTFQDVFDVRFYEYYAQRLAAAVKQAAAHLVPVRVGAAVTQFDKTQRHSFGPATADDGTPAGYPQEDTDHDLTVVRFDDVSNRARPKPLAMLVNWGQHPEFLNGNDLITADYVGPLQRIVDRATGAHMLFTQNAVGTTEPDRNGEAHPYDRFLHERLEFSHKDYAQEEYGAHLIATAVLRAWRSIGAGRAEDPAKFVPFQSGKVAVGMRDGWYPGPLSHPYPGVSNCRTQSTLQGDPRLPVVGLPDCESAADFFGFPKPPFSSVSTTQLEAAGLPIPENYSAPGYTGLEEDVDVHLQAFRIGDILFTVCSCEQWKDQSQNIKTRTDRRSDDEYYGLDWTDPGNLHSHSFDPYHAQSCTRNGDGGYGDYANDSRPYGTGTWSCPTVGAGKTKIPDQLIQHMRAQVLAPANGWNEISNLAYAESERIGTNPAGQQTFSAIKGNFTHDDACGSDMQVACAAGQQSPSAALGYGVTVTIAMANDYNGYIASYREYQRGDHYRKALTGWGPHSSDYMATRLVTMGRQLREPSWAKPLDQQQEMALDAKVGADLAKNDQEAAALGSIGAASIAGYTAALPADGGKPEAVRQPNDVKRFDATFFSWVGGDNFTDTPDVRVQRLVAGRWVDYADQSGELPMTLKFPLAQKGGSPSDLIDYATGRYRWLWTADFEAFGSNYDLGSGSPATPPGTYRFVADGMRRAGSPAHPTAYSVTSRSFDVAPWDGITIDGLRVDAGSVSFAVGPRHTVTEPCMSGGTVTVPVGPIDYPDTYSHPENARYIRYQRSCTRYPANTTDPSQIESFCLTCTFRPWADAGDASSATVTFISPRGGASKVRAYEQGDRWVASRPLPTGYRAVVAVGDVCDRFGDYDGAGAGDGAAQVAGMKCVSRAGRAAIRSRHRHRRHGAGAQRR